MRKCIQSEAEKKWLRGMIWKGFDELSGDVYNKSFGLIKDIEGQTFRHIPDVIAINRRTLDLCIMDHKKCELNGTQCKRTADANVERHKLRGNKGLSMMASWSNSFYQKDLIQRVFRTMTAGNVYYVVVTKNPINMKKAWCKRNPFVVNITESEAFEMKGDMVEIESFDERLNKTLINGYGCLSIDLPTVNDADETFKVITIDGIRSYEAKSLVRPNDISVSARLLI
jgi:hypothetical protein